MPSLPSAWTAIVNPAAGRNRGQVRLAHVAHALARSKLDVDVRLSVDALDLVRIAEDACARGHGVIACGGDGTVSAIAGVVARHDGVLGIVPIGSGNDFARQLGIPRRDVAAAVAVLGSGRVARVDLGRACTADDAQVSYTTVANTGFDADANRWANGIRWATGAPLYVLAALRTLAATRPQPYRVTVDDETFDVEAWLVAVGNTRTYASGMAITPDADVFDGQLDVCIVGAVGRAEFIRTFPTVFRGTHVRHPRVELLRASRVTIEALDAGAHAELWASGERVGLLPATLEAAHAALAVAVP
jgi:diacylglycerol kinase (ATP)